MEVRKERMLLNSIVSGLEKLVSEGKIPDMTTALNLWVEQNNRCGMVARAGKGRQIEYTETILKEHEIGNKVYRFKEERTRLPPFCEIDLRHCDFAEEIDEDATEKPSEGSRLREETKQLAAEYARALRGET